MRLVIVCIGAVIFFVVMSFSFFQKKKTVVFFGDSITQAAVNHGGYIDILKQELEKKGKGDQYQLIGAGISGNKVPDLQQRLQKDVLSKNPDQVFIYIGINDVWHYSHPCCKEKGGTPKEQFENGLADVVNKIKASGAEVVICTPSVIGEKTAGNEQDKMLDEYANISRKVAKPTNSKLCDLRKSFQQELKKINTENKKEGILTSDGVHLNDQGNKLVAQQMLKYL
ncbi:SGNH/GDSL hydrolase family protein [soil metagenome]